MVTTNPYDILGVPKNASTDAVKAAYKKMAMKHHPDKGGNPETFKEINDAFGRIVKPEQFTNNGQGPHCGFAGGGMPFDNNNDPLFREFTRNFFQGGVGGVNGFPFAFNVRGGMPMKQRMEIRLPLESLYTGKHVCVNGINVAIPPNTPFNTRIEVPNTPIVLITTPKKHSTFDVENGTFNLIMRTSISLCEALLGFIGRVKHPNGETLLLTTAKHKVIQHNTAMRVIGKGIPTQKGSSSDLIVMFDVSLPSKFDVDKYTPIIKEMFGWDVPDITKQPHDVCVELE